MKSQLASPTFTPTYAALVAIINTKFPEIGELLLKRVISQVGFTGPSCCNSASICAMPHGIWPMLQHPFRALLHSDFEHGPVFQLLLCASLTSLPSAFLSVLCHCDFEHGLLRLQLVTVVLLRCIRHSVDTTADVTLQFLKAFKRNDKNMAVGCLKFIAHLCNQQVTHEALALEIMVLLLDAPTDDSVEVALDFAADVAALLEETSSKVFKM